MYIVLIFNITIYKIINEYPNLFWITPSEENTKH
jgi:hypothetical protein